MPPCAVNRAEALRHRSPRVGAVDGRDKDDVALVSLDVLEIFDEKGLERTLPALEVALSGPIFGDGAVELLFEGVALRLVEGDDPQAALRVLLHKAQRRLGHGGDLLAVDPHLRLIGAPDEGAGDAVGARVAHGGGEDDQAVVVEVAVGEGDEVFVARTVVPQ